MSTQRITYTGTALPTGSTTETLAVSDSNVNISHQGVRKLGWRVRNSHAGKVVVSVSSDLSTWYEIYDSGTLDPRTYSSHWDEVSIEGAIFVRAQWVNGGTTQTTFYPEVWLSTDAPIAPEPRYGRIPVCIIGRNPSIEDGSVELMCAAGASGITEQSAAVALEILSDDADDDGSPAGNGANTIRIEGIDTNGDRSVQTATMNGTTEVAVTTNLQYVNLIEVATYGSSNANEGTITIQVVSGNVFQASILPLLGRSMEGLYVVPNDYELVVEECWGAILSTANTVGDLATFQAGVLVQEPSAQYQFATGEVGRGSGMIAFDKNRTIPAGSIVRLYSREVGGPGPYNAEIVVNGYLRPA